MWRHGVRMGSVYGGGWGVPSVPPRTLRPGVSAARSARTCPARRKSRVRLVEPHEYIIYNQSAIYWSKLIDFERPHHVASAADRLAQSYFSSACDESATAQSTHSVRISACMHVSKPHRIRLRRVCLPDRCRPPSIAFGERPAPRRRM